MTWTPDWKIGHALLGLEHGCRLSSIDALVLFSAPWWAAERTSEIEAAQELGCSIRSLRRAVARLRAAGLLRVDALALTDAAELRAWASRCLKDELHQIEVNQ